MKIILRAFNKLEAEMEINGMQPQIFLAHMQPLEIGFGFEGECVSECKPIKRGVFIFYGEYKDRKIPIFDLKELV